MTCAARSAVVIGLNHIQLAMPRGQEQQAEDFYAGVLAFERVDKPDPLAARGGCWFRSNGVNLHLGVDDMFTPARKAHPAFVVADHHEGIHRLQAAEAEIVWNTQIDGFERFYTSDPFGNRLEFMMQTGR